jgi:hypothetical protein
VIKMIRKLLKIGIIIESLILLVMISLNTYSPAELKAVTYKAHHSTEPEQFALTIQSIEFKKTDGSTVVMWSGSQDVDFSTASALTALQSFTGNVPAGSYTQIKIKSSYPKIKGSVTVGPTTYYTTADHSVNTTGPAQEEIIKPWGVGGDGNLYLSQDFNTPMELGGAVSGLQLLFDLKYLLLYYDGVKATSDGYDPMGDQNYINAGGKPGMFVGEIPFAIAVGNPGSKEAYEYYDLANPTGGKGRMTLIFDGSDKLIGANARTILVNNTGIFFKLYGGFGSYGSAGVSSDYFSSNGDGTYRLKFECIGPGAPTGAHTVIFDKFTRGTHQSTFTMYNYVSGTDLTVTETIPGDYYCQVK